MKALHAVTRSINLIGTGHSGVINAEIDSDNIEMEKEGRRKASPRDADRPLKLRDAAS
jgi:hypothetical protein